MKQSFLRICCGFLLLAMALSVCTGFVIRVHGRSAGARSSVTFEGEEPMALYSGDGQLLRKLTPGEWGTAPGGCLPVGTYYIFSGTACTEFSLDEKAAMTVLGGAGWYDGSRLHVCRENAGTLLVKQLFPGPGFHTWTLTGGAFSRRKVLKCEKRGVPLSFAFEGLPFGTYLLFLDGSPAVKIRVSRENPRVCRILP